MILPALLSLVGLGLVLGLGLSLAGKYLAVEVDPRVQQVLDALPGANCGACGYPGCSGFAAAVVAGEVEVTGCAPGGKTAAEKIASLLGVDVGEMVERVAVVRCAGGTEAAKRRSEYHGVVDCVAAEIVGAGDTMCPYGCLGLGSCQGACPFDAIIITTDRLAVVDPERCTGCGKCVDACPRGLVSLVPRSAHVHVLCSSRDKARVVRGYCSVGCIACKLCARHSRAFDVSEGLSVMKYDPEIEVPEAAALVCAPGAILDTRRYDPVEWITDPRLREDLKERQAAYKEDQKRLKAAMRAKKEKADRERLAKAAKGARAHRCEP